MKFTLATALISAPALALAGGFFESCPENNLNYSTMNSKCAGEWTSIDLNTAIGTSNGNLKWAKDHFFGVCGHCSLDNDVLKCDCADDNGDVHGRTISLNDRITYTADHKLSFDG